MIDSERWEPGNPSSESTTTGVAVLCHQLRALASEVALGQFTTANNDAAADQTEELPIDMHEMMAQIAPRTHIVRQPQYRSSRLDEISAHVTAKVGQMAFEALGVANHLTLGSASGDHCAWRSAYPRLCKRTLRSSSESDDTAVTGTFNTVLSNPPDHLDRIDWEPPTLTGEVSSRRILVRCRTVIRAGKVSPVPSLRG